MVCPHAGRSAKQYWIIVHGKLTWAWHVLRTSTRCIAVLPGLFIWPIPTCGAGPGRIRRVCGAQRAFDEMRCTSSVASVASNRTVFHCTSGSDSPGGPVRQHIFKGAGFDVILLALPSRSGKRHGPTGRSCSRGSRPAVKRRADAMTDAFPLPAGRSAPNIRRMSWPVSATSRILTKPCGSSRRPPCQGRRGETEPTRPTRSPCVATILASDRRNDLEQPPLVRPVPGRLRLEWQPK